MTQRPLRVLYAGTPAIAVPPLRELLRLHREGRIALAGLLTNPDTVKGRSKTPEPTDTAKAVEEFNHEPHKPHKPHEPHEQDAEGAVPVLKFDTLKGEAREAAAALKPDLLVCFAYGRIFGPKFLALFPLGGVNIHPSLLPRWRGASPIPAAILHRDAETGVTIQRLAEKMDTGDILAQETLPLGGRETTESLSITAAAAAAAMLPPLLEQFAASGAAAGRPQDERAASYCGIIRREDGLVDWRSAAPDIDAAVRAYTPWPLCRTVLSGQTLYILEAAPLPITEALPAGEFAPSGRPGTVLAIAKNRGIVVETGEGALCLTRLQLEARKALDWKSFLNGARDMKPGTVLGE